MTLTADELSALTRLSGYNGARQTDTNPLGLADTGYKVNFTGGLNDMSVATTATARLTAQAQQAATDGVTAMQALASTVAGALATSVYVTTQGRALVAAATPTEACAVIGAASVADVQAALPAGLTYRLDQLNRLAALGAVGNKL